MNTWGGDMHELRADGLLIVGDEASPDHEPPIIGVSACGNDHGKELCCRTGYALQEAAKQLEAYSWFFVLDDDVYVNVHNARQALLYRDPDDLIALGIPSCGPEDAAGFCGGAGYIISQASLRKIMARSGEAFQSDLMGNLVGGAYGLVWDDLSISGVLKRNGVHLEQLDGLYGWQLDNSQELEDGYASAIMATDPLPITFHYVTSRQNEMLVFCPDSYNACL
ncbi:unnamed protein product [Symbiodinium pilosum]|uniref:N-acetylgalactosaminide beta-1,3-galactosyltransferase n=1 Tax=Symbiodinium pilosum TaxID=2952 RepID=A0A812WPQ6_SYMPI|nr:unnamed protein product [Symbiodinium pilosum]